MTKPIQVGLVGIGRAGWGMHCSNFRGRENYKVVAACDIIPSRCEKIAEEFGCKTYDNFEALVNDPEVELVDIATRSNDHYAHARIALAAGKKVILEKPITLTYDEALSLKRVAAVSKGELFIRHNRRFDNDFLHVKEIIASGILGEVFEIKLARHQYARRDDWQTIKAYGGGQLLNWGPHIIDHALRFLNGQVKEMYSNLKRVAAVGDAEDHLKIILTGLNGLVVDLEISGGVALPSPQYLVYGTKGSLSLTGKNITLKYLSPDHPLEHKEADPGTPAGDSFGSREDFTWIEETIPVNPSVSYDMWDELYKAIRCGGTYPISLDEAVQVMQIVSKAKEGTEF